ncbi:MAG: hypothetical protein E7600_09000 [Ruminococcaceae bacterium]|nr:hypothetical protein [Oscillospiraceae bacterium]
MKYENYYETLTEMQKLKWQEKKGPILYKDWYEMISKNLDLETAGALLLSILFYDCTGGTKAIPSKYMKVLKKNPSAMVLLDTYIPATAAATRQWINRHKLLKGKDKTEENEDAILMQMAKDYANKVKSTNAKKQETSKADVDSSEDDCDDLPF